MRPKSATAPSPAWLFALGVVLALFGTHAGRYWDFTVDDAGISFAYARNLAAGHGLVLTPGAERVEAATNLLWCLLLAPAHGLGVPHEALAKILGLAGAALALAGLAFFPSVAYCRKPRYYDLVAPLVTACMPHVALWAVSGLENGLFSGLAVAALVALAHEENDERRFPWSSVLLVLLFATRPDGVLYLGVIGAAKLLRRITPRPARQDIVWGAVLALGIGSLELFRLAYFAYPLPNSFYTKKRTWDFGKDLFDATNQGWGYVGRWLQEYKLAKAIYVVPLVLVGVRAPVARIATFGFVCAAFFFPIYSHGDWMEEFRFLTFGTPFIVLAIAEGARNVVRLGQVFLPRAVRPIVALALTPLVAWQVVKHTTEFYPERLHTVMHHETLEFSWVQARARYFVAAGQRMNIDRLPSLLDPDVGGSSYDGRLQVIDLFGLGDIPIARTHPENPPGSREAIFWERRPTFIHLHGAWFGAMELSRLEEIDQGYLRLPGRLPTGETEGDTDFVRRESIAAPWYLPAELRRATGPEATGAFIDGYTVSHTALEPGRRVLVEVTVANALTPGAGTISLVPDHGRALEAPVEPAGNVIAAHEFLAGERPRARVAFVPPVGHYALSYRSPGGVTTVLGELVVRARAGLAESHGLHHRMDVALREGHTDQALHLARLLGLRVTADPSDREALEALGDYGVMLADRAWVLANEGGAFETAALLAREARAWAADDPHTRNRVEMVAERLADEARDQQRAGHDARAFVLSREAVLTDPRRSWSRRRAEALRPQYLGRYDGGRDQRGYRFATAVLEGTADLDRAVIYLGSIDRWIEAAALVDRAGQTPSDPLARVVVARGLLARGQANEALGLVAGVPCASAHDPELSHGLRAVFHRAYRPGDPWCERATPSHAPPFDPMNGSFEMPGWGVWQPTGDAFGPRPHHGMVHLEAFVNGWRGWHYANSFATASDDRVGLLRSPSFTITSEGISFLVGGGNDVEHVGVRLMVRGHAVLRAAGMNTEGLRRVFWDLRTLQGATATLEIYDESRAGWGHVLADDFQIEPVIPPGSEAPGTPLAAPTEPTLGAPARVPPTTRGLPLQMGLGRMAVPLTHALPGAQP